MEQRKIQKALITGIAGSGRSYLADYIVENHPYVEVHGISRWHSTSTNKNTDHLKGKITIHECDLTDFSSILKVINEVKPDAIFHYIYGKDTSAFEAERGIAILKFNSLC